MAKVRNNFSGISKSNNFLNFLKGFLPKTIDNVDFSGMTCRLNRTEQKSFDTANRDRNEHRRLENVMIYMQFSFNCPSGRKTDGGWLKHTDHDGFV